MTDETKQENPETTAPAQAATETAPPAALDDGASSVSDGGLTLDDSEPEIPQPAEAPAEKPADDIPETSLSLEMDEPEAAPPAPAEEAPVAETPVMEPPAIEDTAAGPVFDDAGVQPETAPPAAEPVMTSPVQEEPSFAENPAPEAPATEAPITEAPAIETAAPAAPAAETPVMDAPPAAEAPPLPPVAEAPQTDFDANAGESFDEFPGDDAAAFGDDGGDDFGDDGDGGDDGFPSEDGMMPPPEKSGSKKKILMAGGALVLAAVVGGGYFVLSSAGEVAPPPKRVAKVAPQDPGPAPKNDFASTNTGGNSDSGTDVIGMAAPPQPAPLANTDNLDAGFGENTALAAIAIEGTNAVPPTDTWTMTDEGSTDDLSAMPADSGETASGDALTADGAETAESGTVSDYDPSRETITVTALDGDALPPPPVDTEADAAALNFTATEGETATDTTAATDTVEATAVKTPDADTAPVTGGATAEVTAGAATTDGVIDDPLAALEENDPLAEENGFTDSPPVAISDLEPPGMMGTQTGAATVETPQIEAPAIKQAADPLTEPAVKAAIAPKANDPLTPAPTPGEPPPLLSDTAQVKEMMPPTKPELTPAEQARIEQARMALSQGELEGDAIQEHKKTLREVPAKEAMIRPLPKSYLIIQRADGQAGKAIEAPQPQAGTSLANISSKPDLMGQAIAEQRAGNTAAALQTYEKILSDNPSDLNALTNMLGILRKQHSTLALEKLTELHSLYPRHPGVAAQLAVTHADKKNYREALHYFDIAASLDKPNAYYPFSKGVILDRMGRKGEANSYYQEALTMLEQGKTGRQQVPLNALRRRLGIPAY